MGCLCADVLDNVHRGIVHMNYVLGTKADSKGVGSPTSSCKTPNSAIRLFLLFCRAQVIDLLCHSQLNQIDRLLSGP